jgi:putative salt-induced outer membrane protein YdiY
VRILLTILFLLYPLISFSQNDTISLRNGRKIYGEIKKIQSNVVSVKTSYSDSDFKIKFKKVSTIKIERLCFILLTEGRQKTGYVRSNVPGFFTITSKDNKKETYELSDLVFLDEISDKFWDRVTFNIDFSFNLTKANNASQFVIEGGLSYRDPKWISNSQFSLLRSKQDATENIKRTDVKADFKRILPNKWYLLSNFGFLSNTEQALESRYTLSGGIGRYLLFTDKLSLGLNFGINLNVEKFINLNDANKSSELYFGSEFDMFDFEDIKLISTLNLFLSRGKLQRFRADYNIDVKYDLPFDLYIKSGFKLNYDNQSATIGSNSDYLFTNGFGWSFN